MEDFKDATVRAITALKCLNIESTIELYVADIPPVGTVLRKGFMTIGDFKLTNTVREELIALQKEAINQVNHDAAYYMGIDMLDNPENYGLI
jgi:hypothetical protein